ncbi:Hypp2428 [Branchiostoma lanceolatum]|uniref:Hypp2428 protein n=1 Tax=Branchiostoma lanceolatum TaxID=7740 RepID=A0A8J9ZT80_BRALA|nr:Hypp2428 [Branchiostoma lanceolatum]
MASAAVQLKKAQGFVRFLLLCVLVTPLFLLLSTLVKTACLIPPLKRQVLSLMLKLADKEAPGMLTTPEECEQRLSEMMSFSSLKGFIPILASWFEAEVFPGGKAADPSLVRLDGSSCRLLQFARAARPLVISFGSNT